MPQWKASYDAVVVGAGPNGLSAAITLGQAGLSTLVVEANESIGGGARTAELTLPGFRHDICSAAHPFALASPFFRSLNLARYDLSWVHSPAPLAHVLPDGRAILLEGSVAATAQALGEDANAYRDLIQPFVDDHEALLEGVLGGLHVPSDPFLFARFGLKALRPLSNLVRTRFKGEDAPALLAGLAAHAIMPLHAAGTSAFTLLLAVAAHTLGWPIARGGSQAISQALLACLREQGGDVVTGVRVDHLQQLPQAKAYLLDVAPEHLLRIAGDRLSFRYAARVQRFQRGPGAFKIDWALSDGIPWQDDDCRRAATLHLAGNLGQIAEAEAWVARGDVPFEPFVLVVQPSLFDRTRAPPGAHTAYAYCHVPHGSAVDMREAIETTIERRAPGFKKLILAHHCFTAPQLQQHDANLVGGDIGGGRSSLRQLFFRPTLQLNPYATSAPDVFICSSSTPPGAGVHGMCGYWAATKVLQSVFKQKAA
ncbi:MAG TPA: NAD(P)/FAD-dependent oxidoreductase [Polyangiaceae bacterium]|nr:NAD(P)/FAD-dependent oxidoreductase [Polyangiaceae bacterium]